MTGSTITDSAVQSLTAGGFWEQTVARRPDAPAVRAGDDVWSYGEFDGWVNRLAHGLRARGVGPGTTVAILLPSSVVLLRIQLAVIKLGAIAVPLIAGSTAAEVQFVIGHCDAELLITDPTGQSTVRQAGLGLRLGIIVEGVSPPLGATALSALESDDRAAPPDPGIDPLAPMAIMYTSGSTGRPKGVVQPSASLATTGCGLVEAMRLSPEDNVLCVLPLFHTAATHMAFGSAVAAGGCVTIADRFSCEGFWPLVRAAGATAAYLFPAQVAILLSAPPTERDRDHHLRVCFSHLRNPPFCDRFGVDVLPGWAMTETCGMGTLTRVFDDRPGGSRVGVPYPVAAEVRVVDEQGRAVRAGQRGEIEFRHPHAMTAYHRDPEQTIRTLRHGWVGSGDFGSVDESGILSFHGRIKNVIKRSGENISGEEVEVTLMAHPAVEEALVFAVPDPIRTEEAYAAVCVRAGHVVAPAALHKWCSVRLSQWKVPRYFALTDQPFPRLANGKTNRGAVKAQADPESAWPGPATRRGVRA